MGRETLSSIRLVPKRTLERGEDGSLGSIGQSEAITIFRSLPLPRLFAVIRWPGLRRGASTLAGGIAGAEPTKVAAVAPLTNSFRQMASAMMARANVAEPVALAALKDRTRSAWCEGSRRTARNAKQIDPGDQDDHMCSTSSMRA